MDQAALNGITEAIIGCAFEIRKTLGSGFLEKVYENAMVIELRSRGLRVEQQKPIPVTYKGHRVGDYVADLLVEGCVIVELKAVEKIAKEHIAQGLHYLAATGCPICLLINFSDRVEVKRLVGSSYSQ
jgi:GxxExxY protein